MSKVSPIRHITKAITWRIVGTLDTMLLSWFITANPWVGLKVGVAELITKMTLYYLHERIWYRVDLSRLGLNEDSRKRHLLKAMSWRIVGSIDTFILGWLISGDPFIGIKISIFEVVTKMILYYLHERVWYRIKFGIIKTVDDEY
ncbi:DUF2061 domain-containing protein [Flavobacterium sp. NRK F10]|uniref:DUF2061 domain-containing protein n=1 Tax=Flavobacterium sediminis TaxID=2201181 RepID=A0A2U8QT92_9FLAO|nr:MULTISPECIES: DUF2061 domain-containing protein [Flavobacterium]AWM13064.1 hypothetical protein DI487_03735 [Flavobacterium sediminis]MCO6174220.1 DUF2061 domain-containing protein [Flavobacterium sp. NRK F10]